MVMVEQGDEEAGVLDEGCPKRSKLKIEGDAGDNREQGDLPALG